MARALRAWAINRGGKYSVRNLRYGPRTRLVRGIYTTMVKPMKTLKLHYPMIQFLIICTIPVPLRSEFQQAYQPKCSMSKLVNETDK